MIDDFTILFSTLMTAYIILRAAKLDRLLPWFETRSLYEDARAREAAKLTARQAAQAASRRVGPPAAPRR